jgi:WD40 repeat protein
MINSIAYSAATETYAFAVNTKQGDPRHLDSGSYLTTGKWPFETTEWRVLPGRWDSLWNVSWSPDGTKLAIITGTGYMNNVVEIVSIDTDDTIASLQKDEYEGGSAIDWSPDGKMLAWNGGRNQVVFLSAPDLRDLKAFDIQYASDAKFSPDGTLVAMGGWKEGLLMSLDQIGLGH